MPKLAFTRLCTAVSLAAFTLTGCVSGPAPSNYASGSWAPGQAASQTDQPEGRWYRDAAVSSAGASCQMRLPADLSGLTQINPSLWQNSRLELAAGDRIQIDVAGDTDMLTGLYMIESDGSLHLQGYRPVQVGGMSHTDLANFLQRELTTAGLIRPLARSVSVRMIESGGVPVSISGAVFSAGSVRPGERRPDSRVGQREGAVTGDDNPGRTLSAAIRAAAGVRPDADITRVHLIRGNQYAVFDMSGWVKGWTAANPTLSAGDRVIVPETSCFDPDLVRPTALTQPGIRVHMSNLTRGANNNAGAGIGEKTGSLPYGTRLLQGLVAMNCVGGSAMQSHRRAILISSNPQNGQSVVIERDIERLVRSANRDDANPYLMPDDAIACYDSRWTNFREALGLVSDIANTATPAIILSNAAN